MLNFIPRGMIYHSLFNDFFNIFKACFSPLNDQKVISEYETTFANYLGIKHATVFPYARTAIYNALTNMNFPKGSEIIMSPITIKPMVDIVIQAGLKPVFVDLELGTYCYDPEKLEEAITPNTKAILLTYLFGLVPDLDKLLSITKKHSLFVIEDFSQALNAHYQGKKIGSFGDISVYSSSPLKTCDTYGGGTAFTNNDGYAKLFKENQSKLIPASRMELVKKVIVSFIRNFATNKWVFSLVVIRLLNLIQFFNPTLHKKLTGARMGLKPTTTFLNLWKQRYTSFQAKVGLKYLQQVKVGDKKRIANIQKLTDNLHEKAKERLPSLHQDSQSVYWQCPLLVEDFDELQKYLVKHGVDSATTNLSLCSHLTIYPKYTKQTPNAEKIKFHAAFIPIYPKLNEKDIIRVASAINDYAENNHSI